MTGQTTRVRTIAAWSIYPLSWLAIAGFFGAALEGRLAYHQTWGLLVLVLIVSYFILERLLPYEDRWSMTWGTFKFDLVYIAANLGFLGAINALLSMWTISLAANRIGPAHDWPLWLQLAVCMLFFEALNYAIHRAMHEGKGWTGRFLWSVHAAHHLPERVYVFMHAVFHPINAFFIQTLAMTLPIWLAGYDQRVVTLFLMINSMHGLISHFNVDVRMGWANYLFVGPELHRYHHSADVTEAKNYGTTLSIFDVLFDTFVYRPGIAPAELGVSAGSGLPRQGDLRAVFAMPFAALWPRRRNATSN